MANASLDELLDKYDDKTSQRAEEIKAQVSEEDQFIQDFVQARDEVIEPALDKFKSQLEGRGHQAYIIKDDPGWDSVKSLPVEPSITLKIELKKAQDPRDPNYGFRDVPSFGFRVNRRTKKIWSHESTIGQGHGGHAGSRGEYTLKEITPQLVESEALGFLKNLLKEHGV
ncbi:MAG: hypothetical protein HZB70_00665 [Candidatus Berkelbacteria bacterium]|nr:MAG: hypothetical protein HZB70_00665 [Candidatus Berkelbacteria bacterium]QQG51383.1 MAG: hypothetical protein HY845_02335 [Candidatus Berkelbacteria bacterium]